MPPSDVLLADGTIAVIRTLGDDDREAVLHLHENVSEDTLRLRFFTANRNAGRQYVARLFDPEHTDQFALVALVRGRLAGLATAEVLSEERAEVAFLVSDQDRGRGLGSLLLEHLAALGRAHGLNRFDADVLADNYGMLRVFRGAGFSVARRTEHGEVSVELRTDVSAAALDASDRREWRSEARSLRPLLAPESVAVVGVRRSAEGIGRAVLDSIVAGGYAGRLSVVHPAADGEGGTIAGVPAYPNVRAVPGPLDLVDGRGAAGRGGRGDRRRLCGRRGRSGRRVVGLLREWSRRRPGPRRARPGAQRPAGRPELPGRAHPRRCGPAQRVVRARAPRTRRARRRLAVGRGRLHAARPGQRPRRRRPLVRLARRQARRVQQRPSRRLGRRRQRVGRGSLPRVVRQRLEVRPHRAPLRRAQAAARRRRRRPRGARRRRHRGPVRPGRGDPLPRRRRALRGCGGAVAAAPARRSPRRRSSATQAAWAGSRPAWPRARA